jgi:opacity protein-like surface antigen
MMIFSGGARCANLTYIRIVSLMVLLSVISTTTMAKEFYGVIDVGKSSFEGSCTGNAWLSCSDTNVTAVRLGLGYRVSPKYGFEVNYGKLGNRKSSGIHFGTPVSGTEKLTAFQFALIGTVPFSESFSFFGKLAVTMAWSDYTSNYVDNQSRNVSSLGWSAGLGAQYDLSRWLAVRTQYESMRFPCIIMCNTNDNSWSASQFSTGLVLKF